jgi:Protein of unknown function (DUF2975)
MAPSFPAPLGLARTVLSILNGLNILYGAMLVVLLALSFAIEQKLFQMLGFPPGATNKAFVVGGLRVVVLIGVASVPLTYIVLTRLHEIVDTVRLGDPFVAVNANRLQTIAWAVLGLQMLNLAVGLVITAVSRNAEPLHIDIDWHFSVTGWLAVLLLFVLARVFDHGARMRDDLEGTV